MDEREEHLYHVIENLIRIKNECSCSVLSDCGLSDMTVRQVAYLKIIDQMGDVTFTRLAGITKTSKPTVSGMIDKFERLECVYREGCPEDGRIRYIRLTGKGTRIAKADAYALQRMIERLTQSLNEHDLDLLIGILRKVR